MMLARRSITDRDTWNDLLRGLPAAHVLQTWEWGEFKRATTGWTPTRLVFERGDQIAAAASILTRRIGPLAVMYVPKGPALAYDELALAEAVIADLEGMARRAGAIWLKIDPDVILGTGVPGEEDDRTDANGSAIRDLLQRRKWRFSDDQVQFRNTITLDLTCSQEDLLAAMSQNTRRKVRTAEKKGVTIRAAALDDLPLLYDLYQATGQRDHFLIRPASYYERAWRDFMQAGLAHALIAEADGAALAHVILFHFGRTCWYFYGASSNDDRDRMPNYLLQWEAMRWAKAQGYTRYDMWGAPDEFTDNDPLWGVYQFKRGFRGVVTRHIGAWDFAPYPPLYSAFTQLWPRARSLLRRVARR
jgi:lipid II:glycine glycyltransferase (peptidoglycan interpeptide bridge formation enzyme)